MRVRVRVRVCVCVCVCNERIVSVKVVMRSRGGVAVGGAPRKHGFPRVDVRLGERLHARGGFSKGGVDDLFELCVHARELVRHAGFDVVVFFLGVLDG